LETHSLTVPFIDNLPVVEGLADEGIALDVAPRRVFRAPSQEIHGEIRRHAIQNLQ